MTIQEVLTRIDNLKPNQYKITQKIAWISDIDGVIYKEIIKTHVNEEDNEFVGYDDTTDLSTELLACEPYSELYVYYLMAQIDFCNGEYTRYNNTSALFNQAYQNYVNYYNRTHRSNGVHRMEV